MIIREIIPGDAEVLRGMMRSFYDSPALLLEVSDDKIENNIKALLDPEKNLFGYAFESDGRVIGFSMLTECWSTEAGGACIWIEDLYLIPEYRRRGFGNEFFAFIKNKFADKARLRLEAEPENAPACALYRKNGFQELGYLQLTIERG